MTDKKGKEWRELTFSQREGKTPLPEPLQAGVLTKRFRNRVWRVIEISISHNSTNDSFDDSFASYFTKTAEGRFFKKFPYSYRFNVLDIPHDEIGIIETEEVKGWLRNLILKAEIYELLTIIEYMLRRSYMPKPLSDQIKDCFDDAPYIISCSSEPICIIPATSEEMKESVKRSLDNINQSKLTGSKSHLCNAAQELSNNNYAAAIRESIHAVEAAARQIDSKASKGLGAALDSLEQNGMLNHKALQDAFMKLYGYTNDEQGIRHPLIEKNAAYVGFDEAIFMYGACVSFIDYLVSRHRQRQEK
ncbi:AbiJ-NTD4 domain-containing protein [Candidatus Spongiihabitans sp.]|uniref:AbiJ-NTD4 domain-containing protein n=1 Tax=Candidatus Spongiihabitans sp. TaxID=3101308 RepID=UPI003C703540